MGGGDFVLREGSCVAMDRESLLGRSFFSSFAAMERVNVLNLVDTSFMNEHPFSSRDKESRAVMEICADERFMRSVMLRIKSFNLTSS